ncbi:histidinol-phosphate transaminase [Thermococcus paralvinellae]|uniref:Histidinol-phosphate aminotransferase n=1 Tax=Thermococcus paralvinellae TaxID=582419 RepID=W0I591_9EURY|nr:histidinol-phosphate transaminase [Thermococcus paralvinellae]AHF79907.1 histidinol-phosphate transaminase [Thermococcus paralvinellae]
MKIRELIKTFQPYKVLEGDYKIWLDKNENPFDLPPEIKEEIFEELRKTPFNRYPHITSMPLREAIAEFYGVSPKNVAVGNGGDELLSYLIKLFDGDYIVTTPPTFAMYYFYAKLNGIPVVEVPLNERFIMNGDEIAEKSQKASIVFITSPNNPTGNTQPREEILKVLDTGAPVVIDEAYAEFSEKSYIDLLDEYENLIILRTFSKAFSLAGVRAGYLLASEEIVDALYRIKSPFSLNVLTMITAKVMLNHYDLVMERVNYIIKERERIYQEFKEYAYPSEANFLLMKLDAYEFLLERGIVVRKLDGRLQGHIRVTIGKKEENDELIKVLKEFVENVADI